MKSARVKLNFILLISFCYIIYADDQKEVMSSDTIKNHCSEKIISLDKKLIPTDRIIEFLPNFYPKLAEPTIIHLNIFNLPIQIKNNNIPGSVLGNKIDKHNDRITNRPNTDTLINGIFQSISLDKKVYKQGEIATLNVTTLLPLIKPEIKFLNQNYKLYSAGRNIYRTVLAVPMDADTGRYFMTLKYEEDNEKKSYKIPFKIIPGDFAEQDTAELDIHILTEETLEMMKFESGKYFAKAYSKTFDTLICDGEFIWPCKGSITSMFGIARKYNNGLDKWSHRAIDISNAVGTKILAANTGVVVLAQELEGHGKSIVIAHGQGIHTVYIHLNKISVAEGDTVIKGQEIGEMGKTGMCTGSNLHFQIMVNKTPTDPRCWIPGASKLKKGFYVSPELANK
ncbi:MAG: M23 family metallopeptidase [candidate division WOR-3 bacterium]